MKKHFLMAGLIGICSGLLIACSSDDSDQTGNAAKTNNQIEKEQSTKSKGSPKDQENLKIGDIATIESTLGKFEVTLESVKGVKEIDGEKSLIGNLLITQLTVKNVGKNSFNTEDQIETLEMVTDINGAGRSDDSVHFGSIKKLTGSLEPGEAVSGEAVFEAYESDEYLLMTNRSFRAGNTVYNNAVWTIQNSEVK